METKKYAIIGGGSWATALAKILTDNKHSINWFIRDEKNIIAFKDRKHNPHYVCNIYFDTTLIHFSNDIQDVITYSSIIIIAIPSAYVIATFNNLPQNIFNNKKIISAIKGIIPHENILLNNFLEQKFSINKEQYGLVAGPCHAEEVAGEKLSYLTFCSSITKDATKYATDFESPYIKTIISNDVEGAQFAAVLKNIYAVGAGIAHGLDYGDNFMSVFITGAADEMVGFLKTFAWHETTAETNKIKYAASVYLGDLLVTCYSLHSRNRRFGNYIGKGYSVKTAQLEMNMVAEGYYASNGIYEINKNLKSHIPIANLIYEILWQNKNATIAFEEIQNLLI